MRWGGWLLVSALVIVGCARPAPPAQDAVDPAARPVVPAPPEPAPPAPAAEPAPPATLTVAAPAEGAVLPAGQPVAVELAGPDGDGELWLWLDTGEPQRIELGQPLDLGVLEPGYHLVRVLPYAEGSLDLSADALLARVFAVGDGGGSPPFDLAGPMLTVGEPSGQAETLESGEVPLDIRVDGVTLDTDTRVRWQVDDEEPQDLREYPSEEPLTLGPFEPGAKRLVVELVGADDKPIENGGLTRVERTFTVPEQEGAG